MQNVEFLKSQITEQVEHVNDEDLLDLVLKLLIAESEGPKAAA